MKVWLDDERPAPDGYDIWVKRADHCKTLIQSGLVDELSFDHDLGEGVGTGYDLAAWVEMTSAVAAIRPFSWAIHSQNPVGAKRIRAAMTNAEKYWRGEK